MTFAQPLWLAAAIPVCLLLAWLYRRQDASQRAALAKFAAARLLPKLTSSISVHRRWLKRGLVMAGIAFTFAALARPQWGEEWRDTHRRGLEIVFAMDTSKSMLAQDVKPDRLQRSKLAVTDLIGRLKGDGVGLIAFAGDAFLQCPVTLDYNAFRDSLEALDTSTIERGGTDIAAAIREAQAVFEDRTAAEKILVLITDGEDLDGEGITAAETAAKKGVKVFTVGVGNATGELVPVPNGRGGTEFARDETGQLVKSKLDESTLRKIAEATGGMYQPLGTTTEGLNVIYDQGFSKLTRGDLSSRQARVPLERFQWPLAAALLCFAGEWLIGNRRRNRTSAQPLPLPVTRKKLPSRPQPTTATVSAATATAGVLLALLFGTAATPSAQAAATPQSAEQAYQKGDYTKAREEYAVTASAASHPEKSAPLHFNTGSAAYKSGDYAQAAASFQETLKNAPVSVQQDAYYNLGNTQFRLGQQTLKDKPEDTIKTWEEAVKSYDAALQINPSDPSAKHNRDLVKRKLEDLKKQQEQQKNQDQNQQDKDKDQNQKDNKDQKDQNKDSKDQQGKDGKDQQQDAKDQQGKDGKDQQQGSKDQQDKDGKDQQQGSKDQQDKDGKDQQQGSKDQQGKDAKDQQQGSKDQQGKDGKDQQQGSKDQQGKDGKDQQQGSKDQQQSADKKDGQKDGKDQPQPVNDSPKPQQGEIKAADPASEQKAAEAAADRVRAAPGQMTREEARQLLDALKSEERRVPSISAQGRAGSQSAPGKKIKDW